MRIGSLLGTSSCVDIGLEVRSVQTENLENCGKTGHKITATIVFTTPLIICRSVPRPNSRHPGDARVNARSGRDVRTSPNRAKVANRANRAHPEIHCFPSPLCAEGPPFRARVWPTYREVMRVKNSKTSLSVAETWRSKRQTSLWIRETRKETLDR